MSDTCTLLNMHVIDDTYLRMMSEMHVNGARHVHMSERHVYNIRDAQM